MYNKMKESRTNVQKENLAKGKIGRLSIDEFDKKILRELLADSRISLRQIASRLKVSVGTIANRIKNLESEKILKYYTTVLDHEKLGYELTTVTEITVSKGKLLEMETEISKIPCVCAVYDVTGSTDAMAIAKFKTREDLSNFTKTLLSMPFIERTETHVVLTTIKEDFRIL